MSMKVCVQFRGICLFDVPRSGKVSKVSVYLPLANTDTKKHLDGTPARPHYAYVYIPKSSVTSGAGSEIIDQYARHSLNGATLKFGGPTFATSDLTTDGLINDDALPDFRKCAADLKLKAKDKLKPLIAAQLDIKKGAFSTKTTPCEDGKLWFVPSLVTKRTDENKYTHHSQLSWSVYWTFNVNTNKALTLTIDPFSSAGTKKTIAMKTKANTTLKIVIANVRCPDPVTWNQKQPCSSARGECADIDFKWLFTLFTPESTIKKAVGSDGQLPIPFYDKGPNICPPSNPPGPTSIGAESTPTCFQCIC